MEHKINVILSTFGPLHLTKSAEYLSKKVNLTLIQGWIPNKNQKWLINILSKIMHRNLQKSFQKRFPNNFSGKNIGIAIPEFILWTGKKITILHHILTPYLASTIYGFLSRKYLTNAQIFHVRSGNGGGGAIEKAKSLGMKVIVDQSIAHNQYIERTLKPEYDKYHLEWGYGSSFWKKILSDCQKADILLVNSNFVKQTFIDAGYEEKKIKVAYLGVRRDFLDLKKDYEIKGNIKILFTGGFGFRKGGLYILQALKKLDSLNINYKFTVVGSHSDEQQILNKYLPNHIEFIGFIPQDELKSYLSTYDIYLFPSLVEGCASSAMEAMAAGLPIIATISSGLPIKHKENGYLVPIKDVDAIVNAILELKSNTELRAKLGKNAANLIRNNFSWENYAHTVNDIYTNLLIK